jgi:hypothetical protein
MFFKEERRGRERAEEEGGGGSLGERRWLPPLQGSLKQTLQSTLVIYKILEKTLIL